MKPELAESSAKTPPVAFPQRQGQSRYQRDRIPDEAAVRFIHDAVKAHSLSERFPKPRGAPYS